MKEGMSVGLPSGNLLAKQQLSLEMLSPWDDAVLYGAKPKKVVKKKAKEVAKK